MATIAAALSAVGVTKGDIVAGQSLPYIQWEIAFSVSGTEASLPPGSRSPGYLPNSALAVEAMLATASVGAVWTSTSPDFGVTVSEA